MNITIVVGARPNFMKIAPVIKAIEAKRVQGVDISFRLVHTGQHYDKRMSGDFLAQLGIPEPNSNLEAGGGTQAEQTAMIMVRFEKELVTHPSDLLIVVGDVTSTMACAIVAQKLQIPVGHIEAGIRSGDWSMPEEINRLVTDSISNYFFTTSKYANENLLNSGVAKSRIFFVGNTMIDTLLNQMPNFVKPKIWDEVNLIKKDYFVLTLHRPANVDNEKQLKNLISKLTSSARNRSIIFPVHPRTASKLKQIEIEYSNLYLVEPLNYLEFNYLVQNSKAVITDSGGITEETTVMGVPCMTLRDNTERPETCFIGTNELIGTNPDAIPPAFEKLFDDKWKSGQIPELWDGKAASRIVDHILEIWNL